MKDFPDVLERYVELVRQHSSLLTCECQADINLKDSLESQIDTAEKLLGFEGNEKEKVHQKYGLPEEEVVKDRSD